MAAPVQPRILVVDTDTAAAERIGLTLDGAGLGVGWCSFAPTELTGVLRELQPTMLLLHGELASPQVSTALARLDALGLAGLPVVLLCRDVADEVFTRPMRTGVVELLAEPFNPRVHLGRLRMLLAELPERTGKLKGRGSPHEVQAVVTHVTRTRRTGGLTVGEREDGRAFFVRGVLKSARYHALEMQSALADMVRSQGPWSFAEGVEGNAGVIELEFSDDDALAPAPVARASAPRSATPSAPRAAAPSSPRAPAPSSPARFDPNRVAGEEPPRPAPDRFGEAGRPAPAGPFEEPRSPPAASAPVAPEPGLGRAALLFVDDDPAVVNMLGSYFSKKGCTVVTAVDGVDALSRLVAQPVDAVIADLNMPRLDGWGLLRLIREDFRTWELPVALFSAQDNYRESLRLLHAGAQAYFPKTLRLAALEVQVRELLEPRRRFQRLIDTDGGMEFDLGALGPQWVCRALAEAGYSGQLDARDSWATWRLVFSEGRLAQVHARVGAAELTGDRALCSFLTSRAATGSLLKGLRAADEGFGGHATRSTLDRLVPWLNEEHRRAREGELSRARALTVHDELYRLYVTVGPPAWLPMVRLLCEAKLPPAEVIAQLQVTPAELAAVVKDLLRRGVASLE